MLKMPTTTNSRRNAHSVRREFAALKNLGLCRECPADLRLLGSRDRSVLLLRGLHLLRLLLDLLSRLALAAITRRAVRRPAGCHRAVPASCRPPRARWCGASSRQRWCCAQRCDGLRQRSVARPSSRLELARRARRTPVAVECACQRHAPSLATREHGAVAPDRLVVTLGQRQDEPVQTIRQPGRRLDLVWLTSPKRAMFPRPACLPAAHTCGQITQVRAELGLVQAKTSAPSSCTLPLAAGHKPTSRRAEAWSCLRPRTHHRQHLAGCNANATPRRIADPPGAAATNCSTPSRPLVPAALSRAAWAAARTSN